MLQGYPSKSKTVTVTAAIFLLLLGAHLLYSNPSIPRWRIAQGEAVVGGKANLEEANAPVEPDFLPCQQLPGAEDVVVVMRTGATEIQDKLPIHFNTTFVCYQDLLIFSDYAENFYGHQVHDVLASVDQGLKESNNDFELYLRLQQHGRESLHDYELSGKASFEGSKSGKGDNPGWKLDKWKFLPMMNETLKLRPDKKWYVFVESDSYAVWSNILQWVEQLDPSLSHYYGSEVQIGPDVFAHGGSVFVMSKPAIEKGAQIYADKLQEWHDWTNRHWAGDCILGKALLEAGVPLTWGWPMFQGGHPAKMDFTERKGEEKQLWCTPALSYHHFSPTELKAMWEFEQLWIQSRLEKASKTKKRWSSGKDYSDVLEHRDVFREFVLPSIQKGKRGWWNNLSPNLVENTAGAGEADCQRLCEENGDCLQYLTGPEGCSLSTTHVMLGEYADGFKSGWMDSRVDSWMQNLDTCDGHEGWTAN
ncbi:hypothetical protein LTR37_014010 [Vermiconidia calcicola]|uniref:Uncharacterized protein n=1 Tax=Vermiconidia calcicola TaxID=1690605 RepID=A0ACC3MWA7_9PEZI|nr:hypothetical protein LTR37_014010 [Vermiconidia calcicola]